MNERIEEIKKDIKFFYDNKGLDIPNVWIQHCEYLIRKIEWLEKENRDNDEVLLTVRAMWKSAEKEIRQLQRVVECTEELKEHYAELIRMSEMDGNTLAKSYYIIGSRFQQALADYRKEEK